MLVDEILAQSDHDSFLASLDAVVSLTFIGGDDGHLIRVLLDNGLD